MISSGIGQALCCLLVISMVLGYFVGLFPWWIEQSSGLYFLSLFLISFFVMYIIIQFYSNSSRIIQLPLLFFLTTNKTMFSVILIPNYFIHSLRSFIHNYSTNNSLIPISISLFVHTNRNISMLQLCAIALSNTYVHSFTSFIHSL